MVRIFLKKLEIKLKNLGINTTANNIKVAKSADILVLSIKPNIYPMVINEKR